MNIEEFREFCLSLPGVTEKMPFGAFRWAKDILVFYVKGKMFCFFDISKFDRCTIKCDPMVIDELIAMYYAVGAPFNSSLKYWISIRFNDDMPDDEIKRLCEESYNLIYGKNNSKASSKKIACVTQ